MKDTLNRRIDYLRISVTDRCNMRCIYCIPPEGVRRVERSQILSYEEITRIVRAAAELGVEKIRLTGGEPLVRLGLADLVAMITRVPGIKEVALTTNGTLLADHARGLAEAGLSRVNISLDTLRPDRFQSITRSYRLQSVLEGIEAAEEADLKPLKINTVVMRGVNDDELLDFAKLTFDHKWCIRFIEMMPITSLQGGLFISCDEILNHLRGLGELEPATPPVGNGPARYYRLPEAQGVVGAISPLSYSFCEGCNRIRLTADGRLRPCLFGEGEIDLRAPLRRGASIESLKSLILSALKIKPKSHKLRTGVSGCGSLEAMSQIGG